LGGADTVLGVASRTTYRAWSADVWRQATLDADRLTGKVRWSVEVGTELPPHSEVCDIEADGASLSVGVDHHGRLVECLVPEGAEVGPDEPLFVMEGRPPTTAEFDAERNRRYEAEAALRAARRRGPVAAFWHALRSGRS
jgi:pyruvate/2-oxoglutarate dehydrogenase complex dihydrolipoamide acyltransferase (E2) component